MRAQGWRFVFFVMSALALTVTVLVIVFGIEPRNLKAKRQGEAPKQAGAGGAAAVWANLRALVSSLSSLSRLGYVRVNPHAKISKPNSARMIWGGMHPFSGLLKAAQTHAGEMTSMQGSRAGYRGCLPPHRDCRYAGPG